MSNNGHDIHTGDSTIWECSGCLSRRVGSDAVMINLMAFPGRSGGTRLRFRLAKHAYLGNICYYCCWTVPGEGRVE